MVIHFKDIQKKTGVVGFGCDDSCTPVNVIKFIKLKTKKKQEEI